MLQPLCHTPARHAPRRSTLQKQSVKPGVADLAAPGPRIRILRTG
jgi:hypothetical protein